MCSVTQPCLTLRNPMDCSPPASSVHGILQARILEWVACPPSPRGSSLPRDQTQVSHIGSGFFTIWATRKGPILSSLNVIPFCFIQIFVPHLCSQNFYISGSYCFKECAGSVMFNCMTLWIEEACQAPLSIGFSRQEYPRDLPSPRIEPTSPVAPALVGRFFTT